MVHLRALVIDDSRTVRMRLSDILRPLLGPEGSILEAADAAEGAEHAREACPDLVFLDLILPDRIAPGAAPRSPTSAEAGLLLLDTILHADPRARVVVVTGLPREDAHVVEALSRGASAYVRKPVSPESIGSALRGVGQA